MHSNLKINLEKVFQNSKNPDELFDAFQLIIYKKVNDLELFKILLANPVLSQDELLMFTEKLALDFPGSSYDIYLWLAKVIENKTHHLECQDIALKYLIQASRLRPENNEPLIRSIDLYNFDLELSLNENIISFINKAIGNVNIKSKIYYRLARLYKKLLKPDKAREYEMMAEKTAAEENQ
jgi:hypothetical protein